MGKAGLLVGKWVLYTRVALDTGAKMDSLEYRVIVYEGVKIDSGGTPSCGVNT